MNYSMYSLFSKTVNEHGWESAADTAKNYGCSSVEIFDVTDKNTARLIKDKEDAHSARKVLESKGLSVACYSVLANLYKSPSDIEELKKHAEHAAAIGSPFLHHTVLPWFDTREGLPEFDEAIECAVDAAEEVANHAANFGVTCIYEDQGFFANGIEGYGIFFNELKRRCKNVGVCGDMGNSLFVDLPGEKFFEAYIDDIKHVHAKDYFQKHSHERPGKEWLQSESGVWLADAPMGEGVVDIASCIEILKRAGYKGAIAIEAIDIPHSIEYLKKFEFNQAQ